MKLSQLLFRTIKGQTESNKTTDRLIRSNYILQESSGIFSYAPLGTLLIENIKRLIRSTLIKENIQEIYLPILQDMKLWIESGRDKVYGPEMFRINNRENKQFCLAATAEESVVHMIKNFISSYKSLPMIVYQMLNKYRDELRPRYGLIRCKEFIMFDAYSFDESVLKCQLSYTKMYQLYIEFFNKLQLDFIFSMAECGEVGGSFSQNVFIRSENGEDTLHLTIPWQEYQQKVQAACTYEEILNTNQYVCATGIYSYDVVEVGHIFNLGDKYSKSMNASFINSNGQKEYYEMGCYGIGISRLLSVIMEKSYIPDVISPYKFHIISVNRDEEAEQIYKQIPSCLYDNRDCGPGTKFADADLIGIPNRIIIGKNIEYKDLINNTVKIFENIEELIYFIQKF